METKRYLKTSESLRRMHLIIVFHTTSDRTWLLGSHIKRCIICKGRHSKIAYVNATYRKIASKHGSMQEDYQGVGDCRIHLTHKEKMTIFFEYRLDQKGTYFEVLCPKQLLISEKFTSKFWKAKTDEKTFYLNKIEVYGGCK